MFYAEYEKLKHCVCAFYVRAQTQCKDMLANTNSNQKRTPPNGIKYPVKIKKGRGVKLIEPYTPWALACCGALGFDGGQRKRK